MKLDKSLEPFRAAIESLQQLLTQFNDRGVIIGGVAVDFLGEPHIPDAEDFARKNRVLLFKHQQIRILTFP